MPDYAADEQRAYAKCAWIESRANEVKATVAASSVAEHFGDVNSQPAARAAIGLALLQDSVLAIVQDYEWKLTVTDISRLLCLDNEGLWNDDHKTWIAWDIVRRLLDDRKIYKCPHKGRSYIFGTARPPHMREEYFRVVNNLS
mgnify:CR=1 FL=1